MCVRGINFSSVSLIYFFQIYFLGKKSSKYIFKNKIITMTTTLSTVCIKHSKSGIKTPKNQSINQSWLDTGTSIKSGGLD
jgi:hypothetical protein